eukprot:scaffold27934_cov73-Skeletonema_marinoi.AAC.1
MTLSCQVYHITSLTPQLTVFAFNKVPPMPLTDRDSELNRAVEATFFRSKIMNASISFVLFDAPIADEHLL